MGIIEGTRRIGAGVAGGARRTAVGLYDFAQDGGAVGDITLRGDTVPSGSVILDAYINVETSPTTGGSPTIAIKVEGAADIQSAAAHNAAPWSTTGTKRATFTATTAPITTTAARSIVATVATAALTGGKFTVVVEFIRFAS